MIKDILLSNKNISPDSKAIVDEFVSINHNEVYKETIGISNQLLDIGIESSDTIAICTEKAVASALLYYSIINIGAIAVPLDVLNHNEVTVKYSISAYDNDTPSRYHWIIDILGSQYKVAMLNDKNEIIFPDDIVYLNSTSGSTGLRKFGLTSWENIKTNAVSMCKASGFDSQSVFLCLFPFHMHFHENIMRGLITCATSVLISSEDPNLLAHYLLEYKVTHMLGTPAQLFGLASYYQANLNTSLKYIECAGGSLSARSKKMLELKFETPVIRAWGSTETAGVCISDKYNESLDESHLGKAVDNYHIYASDEINGSLSDVGFGEMVIFSPGNIRGILEKNHLTWFDGSIRTQDNIRKDVVGNIFFMGRKSNMIKTGGENVYPEEVRKIINSHPHVLDSVVLPLQDDIKGEIPAAFVLSDTHITRAELIHFCVGKLANHKVPKVILFGSEFPLMGNGKVDYKRIIEKLVTCI